MADTPRITLHAINTEIEKVLDALKKTKAAGPQADKMAKAMNQLEQLQASLKVICTPEASAICTFEPCPPTTE